MIRIIFVGGSHDGTYQQFGVAPRLVDLDGETYRTVDFGNDVCIGVHQSMELTDALALLALRYISD